jgi:hypothetical protein
MASHGTTKNLFIERTNLHVWLLAIIVALLAVSLLILAEFNKLWVGIESLQGVVREIGSFLLVSVAVALLWELKEKRVFRDEILSEVQLSGDIRSAGIVGFTPSTHQNIDWDMLFRNVEELDILFSYGRTWRRIHGHQLQEAAGRKAHIRVVLPDPNDATAVAEIAKRSRRTETEIRELILEAATEFYGLHKLGAKVNVWFLPDAPQFSFYRFDHTIVLAIYSHRTEDRPAQLDVPAFTLAEGGSFYKFVQAEFHAMISNNGLARLAY